jgi:hypothetical protein
MKFKNINIILQGKYQFYSELPRFVSLPEIFQSTALCILLLSNSDGPVAKSSTLTLAARVQTPSEFCCNIFKGLVAFATLFIYLFLTITYIHNYIRTIHSSISIRRGLFPFSSLLSLSGKNLPGGWILTMTSLGAPVQSQAQATYLFLSSFWDYISPNDIGNIW